MAESMNIGGEGGQSFPFENAGDTVTGKILSLEEVQQTDLQTGQPAFWDGGQPKMMYRVTLQTDLHATGDDDGVRSVYLKGSRKAESKSSLAAVIGAAQAATGKTDLRAGGTLTLQYIGDGVASQRGFNAPKLYAAAYQPPAVNLAGAVQAPQGQPVVAAATPPPAPQPVMQQPAVVVPAQPAPVAVPAAQPVPQVQQPAPVQAQDQLAALAAMGITPEQLAALAAAQQQPAAG